MTPQLQEALRGLNQAHKELKQIERQPLKKYIYQGVDTLVSLNGEKSKEFFDPRKANWNSSTDTTIHLVGFEKNFHKVYHATDYQCAQMIVNNGFKQSRDGRLGKGVYFVDNLQQAQKIAKYRSQQRMKRAAIIESEIELSQWKQSIHPKWAYIKYGFREYCVPVSKVKVIRVLPAK